MDSLGKKFSSFVPNVNHDLRTHPVTCDWYHTSQIRSALGGMTTTCHYSFDTNRLRRMYDNAARGKSRTAGLPGQKGLDRWEGKELRDKAI